MKSISKYLRELVGQAARICLGLFKIMVPVIVVVKILQECGLIERLGILLEPVMRCVGLPGPMGLAWATAMVTNLYGGIMSYLALATECQLTVGQVTILSSMMLIAHALPVEVGITSKAGARFVTIAAIRVLAAFLFGVTLKAAFSYTGGRFDMPASASISYKSQASSLPDWAWGQVLTLGKIFLIVLGLVILLRVLKKLKVTDLIERSLKPILAPIGIGKEATNVTTIGMVLGLSYGGGLIIDEVERGHIKPKDVFLSLVLMSLCHSVIEDTLLMLALGGTVWGLLVGRVVFTFLLMILLGFVVRRLGQKTFGSTCFRKRKTPPDSDKESSAAAG